MKLFKLCTFFYLLSFASFSYSLPTLTILSREYNGDGTEHTTDKRFYALFQEILSGELKTTAEWTNHARLIKRLSSVQPVCSYNIIKTKQREKLFLFSDAPTTMYTQRKLYGLKETLKGLPETVSVSMLLANKNTFGISLSTSYQQLDTMFADYKHQVASISRAADFSQLAQLLMHKRVDMIVSYDYTLKRFLSDDEYSQLDSRNISEYPGFINGHFACSRTAEGKKAISLLNDFMHSTEMYTFLESIHIGVFGEKITEQIMQIYINQYQVPPNKSHHKVID